MSDTYDVIIIGAGHNGLTCGCYLARAGLKVLILERRHIVGGAAISEETIPGYTFSVYAYNLGQMPPKIVRDLELRRYGVRTFPHTGVFRPVDDQRFMMMCDDVAAMQRHIARFSEGDAESYPEFLQYLEEVAPFVQSLRLQTPFDVVRGDWRSLKNSAAFVWKHRRIGDGFYELIDLFTLSAEDFLSRWFESTELKAALAFGSGVIGLMGPKTRGSAWASLFGILNKHSDVVLNGQVVGGMGTVTQAMARYAEEHGAKIELNSDVSCIQTSNGRAISVATSSGREYWAETIVGNVHARLLFDRMVGAEHLPEDFIGQIRRFKTYGTSFKLNIACEMPPRFSAFDRAGTGIDSPSFTQIAPTLEYLNRAHDDAEPGWYSSKPWMYITVPTYMEPTLAPEGKHIVQIYGGHACYDLTGGSWSQERPTFLGTVLSTVDEFAPGFSDGVIDAQLILPEDIERDLNIPSGHIHHGDMTIEQMFFRRPAAHYSDYRSPIKGLYQCGSSTHPGGGVSGVPGHNAAREILRDLGRRSI